MIREDKLAFNVDLNQPYYIYVPKNYYSESLEVSLKNFIPHMNLVPYSFKILPKGFKDLRSLINGKVFIHNKDLEQRIYKFNYITENERALNYHK